MCFVSTPQLICYTTISYLYYHIVTVLLHSLYEAFRLTSESRGYVRAALQIYNVAQVELSLHSIRAQYLLSIILRADNCEQEADSLKRTAALRRKEFLNIEPDIDDNLLAYDHIVPYEAR